MAHSLVKSIGPFQFSRAKLSRLLTTTTTTTTTTTATITNKIDNQVVGKTIQLNDYKVAQSIAPVNLKPQDKYAFTEELKAKSQHLGQHATGVNTYLRTRTANKYAKIVPLASSMTTLKSLRDYDVRPARDQPALYESQKYTTNRETLFSKVTPRSIAPFVNSIKGSVDLFSQQDLFSAQNKENAADLGQLDRVADIMNRHIPKFFNQPHPFDLYTRDMVFMDNIRSVRIQGSSKYATRLALIKLNFALRYSSSKVEILNLVKLPEESCIRIRWRVISRPGLTQFLVYAFKFHSAQLWSDGISTLHVNNEGKIYCHIMDNIDIDEDGAKIKKVKSPLVDRGLSV